MDKFFYCSKRKRLNYEFRLFLRLLFNYRRRISTSDEVKKHPAKKQGVFLFKKNCEKGQLLHI